MSFQKQNYFQRRTKPKGPKANERIRTPQVQVIGSDGNNLGTLDTQEAIRIAKQEGLDLIEISPNSNPPVCKIIDIGKYKYDLQKKANKAKKADQFAAKKLAVLADAYGMEKNSTGLSFRMPQITLRYEVAPAKGKPESTKPILRIHVMDQAAGSAEQLKDAMTAFGGDGVFHKVERNTVRSGYRHRV